MVHRASPRARAYRFVAKCQQLERNVMEEPGGGRTMTTSPLQSLNSRRASSKHPLPSKHCSGRFRNVYRLQTTV